jgi:hypothetical protein
MTEVRGQMTEVRGQKTEVGSWNSEGGKLFRVFLSAEMGLTEKSKKICEA